MSETNNKPAFFSSACCALVRVLGVKRTIALAVVLAAIVVAVIVAVGLSSRSDIDSRMVDFGLRDIGELVTQSAHYTNVQVDKEARDLWGMTLPFTQSKYIYSYDGTVKASIDFAAIQTDVDHGVKKIVISLPDQVKLDVYVDPASMVIYDETKNIFTPLSLERTNSALLELETEVLEKAKANGIEEAALSNARLLVQSFIAGAVASEGYSIEFAD